uniref:NADH-ubiquinone oxidoreductase chain 3 n=1 Tax=Metschnikowia arizonensis TaxID=150206 RepID=A0A7D7HYH5_9ASCO|nr:Nad3 [Metschnikowia arizonensis]QMJ95756.1 Nad3 [Metschnikowia arizonensis]QMJ95768.1 Nad3 [Metschnikowia arizonensis]
MFYYFLILAPMMASLLMIINYLLSNNNTFMEKSGPFECGFTSYQQSRSAFSVSFILVAITFLPFDLEMSSILPYVISSYYNNLYGLSILLIFLFSTVLAFIYEINLNALTLKKQFINKIKELKTSLYIHLLFIYFPIYM